MDQSPETLPSPSAGGKPKVLSGINGVIAGLTGLAVALGGLVTAYKAITDDKPAREQAAAAKPEPAAEPAAAEEEEQAIPTSYKGDLYNEDDEAFDGGSMQLDHDGERWILTANGETYGYDQLATKDERLILAHNAKYGSTLRWLVDGGEVEESTKAQRDAWKTYAKVKPAN